MSTSAGTTAREITRKAPLPRGSYNPETRAFTAVAATGTPVQRYDYFEGRAYSEILAVNPKSVRLERLQSGRAPLLDSHRSGMTKDQVGVITAARIEGGELLVDVKLSSRPDVQPIADDLAAGVLRNISVGYRVHRSEEQKDANGVRIVTHVDWEPYEVSLVTIPADGNAHVRSHIGEISMETAEQELGADPAASHRSADQAPASIPERRRIQTITDIGRRAGMDQAAIDAAVGDGTSIDAFRTSVFDHLVSRASQTRTDPIIVHRDEGDTRVHGMGAALVARAQQANGVAAEVPAYARGYMECSLSEMAQRCLGHRGRIDSVPQREEILRRAFHSTSDFPAIFENAMNGVMLQRYQRAEPTYRRIAAQRTFRDFRPHRAVRAGDFPMLQSVGEGGEIKFGTFSESKEEVAVAPYAVQFSLSRQMLVNDDMGALDQLIGSYGDTVAFFEEATFYSVLLANSGAGPALKSDGKAVFHTDHGNLAGTPGAISVATVSAGREAMRLQKTLDGQLPNIAPAIILTGPKKETEAEQLVATIQPQQSTSANPFSGKLQPVTAAHISGAGWYLFADPARFPVFQWGLLDGYAAPRIRIESPFGVQGIGVSLEHDFGCGAIDYRGAYRNAGA